MVARSVLLCPTVLSRAWETFCVICVSHSTSQLQSVIEVRLSVIARALTMRGISSSTISRLWTVCLPGIYVSVALTGMRQPRMTEQRRVAAYIAQWIAYVVYDMTDGL
ncbi:hypothetical protein BD311DRAFT_756129 [Dichomitus squalens]|uniref:Secreted protein n=1 Tax=Dichomitus squalens TaxID=114155 RepID=A0A4Q9MQ99_9APHY|nr:hypothetical protein BD311DRAFT_756129 [Dichomitus squalens]